MNAERFRRVEELFLRALTLGPDARRAYLDRECGGDSDLRKEVESLLARRTQADGFLESRDSAATVTILLGQQFGPYRILSPLGAGGMGEVYRAHDSKLGRDVAIKILPRAFAHDPERLVRFRREARTLASFNHPNIAAIYGLEESQGATCLVLELVEGETLHGPLPIPIALNYARQIAEGLEAAHEKGVVHRDLKPANLKVTPQGRVKILDFGLAKAVWGRKDTANLSQWSASAGLETVAGHIVGTPPYMGPEQARGEDVDRRTDIWAFGCVLYELLTGKRAFRGETLATTIQAILEREPDWSALPTKTPPAIAALLKQCLQKDLKLRVQVIRDGRTAIEKVQKGKNPWALAAAGAGVVALLAAGAGLLRSPQPANRDQWVQLTNFPDSVGQPALSPDGRMLTFVRGPGTFHTAGQVYVKLLPDGEPKQLTRDDYRKMSPVFSPDGSQIAYTTVDNQFNWDTWLAPVLGGEPQRWLPNASGLVWIDPRRLLFSEIKMGIHMAVVTAEPTRAGARDLYVPPHERGMGHRSYPSPDGKWALLVEMDHDGAWSPCRLVPMDGSSEGQRVGPPGAGCTFGAWSPDGKWIYLTSAAGGVYHVWRQRFPDGEPEQVTSGLTEEEGIAMAPDGSSFITAVALKQRAAIVHDARGERQISLEGYAYNPIITPDGKKVCYQILKGPTAQTGTSDLWITDLETGRNELLFPGVSNAGAAGIRGSYDISPDGTRVLVQQVDGEGKQKWWLAPLDRRSAPRQIPGIEGHNALFGPGSEIFFRAIEGSSAFVYHVREDGTGLRKAIDQPVLAVVSVSPDGQWLAVNSPRSGSGWETVLHPLGGGPAIRIWVRDMRVQWSRDGQSLFMSLSSLGGGGYASGKTYVVPLPRGRALPDIPPGGFQSEEELARLPGVRIIEAADVNPGPAPDVYTFSRETTQRNLYRIALR